MMLMILKQVWKKCLQIFLQDRIHGYVRIEKLGINIRIPSESGVSPVIRRTQFPLMLVWACTAHKVHVLMFEEIVVNFDLLKQKQFKYGQMYVALSRVPSLRGIHLTGEFKAAAIRSYPRAIQEYNRMRTERQFLPLNLQIFNKLNKHLIYISWDKRLREMDVICLTETQILLGQKTERLEEYLLSFGTTSTKV